MTRAAPRRRTQLERRTATIRKLLDAGAETLVTLGHAEASVQRICARAGVSQGALFRHFATREALLIAVGEDVGARLLDDYRRRFAALPRREHDLAGAIRLLRACCRSRLNQAWFELAVAARTSARLRRGLAPVARRYFAAIVALARELLPGPAARFGETFAPMVGTLLAVFDGEVLHRLLLPQPRDEAVRLDLLAGSLAALARR